MADVNWNNIVSDKSNRTVASAAIGAYDSMNGDFWSDSVIGQFLFPGAQQEKEFGEQVALQQYQNEWNSAPNQMEQMRKAGINANLAAQGIVGTGNVPSVGSPNTAVGAGAQGLGAAAQAAGALNDAVNAGVNAYEKLSLTSTEKERRKAEISNLLSTAFHNEWLGRAVAEMLPLQKENERADTWLKLANFDKARSEKHKFDEQVKVETERINLVKKQAYESEMRGDYEGALKLKTEAETDGIKLDNDIKQWDKDFREKWHFDNTKPIDNALIEAMTFEYGDSDNIVQVIGKAIQEIAYMNSLGHGQGNADTAFDVAYNTSQGDLVAALEKMEKDKEIKEELIKAGVRADEVKHVADIILKYLFGIGFSVNVGKFGITNQNP